MAMRSLADLMEEIIKATISQKLLWNERNEHSFSAELPRYRLDVWQWADPDDPETRGITAQLKNLKGKLLDEMIGYEFSSNHAVLARLFAAARRSANDIDTVLGEMAEDLASLKPTKSQPK